MCLRIYTYTRQSHPLPISRFDGARFGGRAIQCLHHFRSFVRSCVCVMRACVHARPRSKSNRLWMYVTPGVCRVTHGPSSVAPLRIFVGLAGSPPPHRSGAHHISISLSSPLFAANRVVARTAASVSQTHRQTCEARTVHGADRSGTERETVRNVRAATLQGWSTARRTPGLPRGAAGQVVRTRGQSGGGSRTRAENATVRRYREAGDIVAIAAAVLDVVTPGTEEERERGVRKKEGENEIERQERERETTTARAPSRSLADGRTRERGRE